MLGNACCSSREDTKSFSLTYFCPPFQHLLSERLTTLGIMGEPRVPFLNPTQTIALSRTANVGTVGMNGLKIEKGSDYKMQLHNK